MDTDKKQDDKKIAIGKNGKKSQIILNPPEIQTPVPYKENFLRALSKHRYTIEQKNKIILATKAAQHAMSAEVIEQVFMRGIKSLPINSNLTREQHAMNRVNSFLSGGAAMKEDFDLLPIYERLGMKGTGGAMRPHIKREKSPYNNKFVYHVVDAKGRIKHSTNNEIEAKKHLALKYNSYMEGTESPMKRFEGTKSLVKTYKDDTPGEKKDVSEEKMKGEDPCWKGYEMVGQKIKAGRKVPNCVPKNEEVEQVSEGEGIVTSRKTRASFLPPAPGTYAHALKSGEYAKYGFTKSGKETAAAKRERMKKEEAEQSESYFRNRGSLGASAHRAFKRAELEHELGHEDRAMARYSSGRSYSAPEKQEPHAVHINGKKWKTFGSQRHAQNVANKIKGATVHKEEVALDEISQQTKDSYKQKATAQVKELKPFTKKGEYKDIASRLMQRRQKGIAKVKDDIK